MKKGVIVSLILALLASVCFNFCTPIKSAEATNGISFAEFNNQFKQLIKDDDYSTIFIEKDITGEELVNVLTEQTETNSAEISSVVYSYTNSLSPTHAIKNNSIESNIFNICEDLNYNIEETNTGYEIYSKFKFKRLLVAGTISENYGASTALTYKNYNILEYNTEEETKYAYENFSNNENLIVVCDALISADSVETNSVSYDYSTYKNQWGAQAIDVEVYNDYLSANNHGQEIVVAVLDTGIRATHELFDDASTSESYDRLLKDDSGSLVGLDYYETTLSGGSSYTFDAGNFYNDGVGHGTHVSGTIAELTPNNVKILTIKVFNDSGSGTLLVTLLGLASLTNQFSEYNIVAANLSLGDDGTLNSTELEYYDELFSEEFENLRNNNILPIVTAGNDYQDSSLRVPARCDNAVTVGAVYGPNVMSSGTLYFAQNQAYSGTYYFDTYYSNYGDDVDIVAPGTGICSALNTSDSGYTWKTGTSMAAPHVSAVVALLCCDKAYYISNTLTFTASEIEQRIYQSATTFNKNGASLANCYGLVNLENFNGSIEFEVTNTTATYDGTYHNIVVTVDASVSNYTITYGLTATTCDISDITTNDIFKNYTAKRAIYFKIVADGYITTTGYGYLTINKAPISIKIANQTATYGSVSLNQGSAYYTKTSGTIYNSDDLGITLATTASNTSNVGSYSIIATCSNTNYNLSYTAGSMVISAKPITIELSNQTGTYGDTVSLSSSEYIDTYNAIINSDDLALNLTTTATSTSNVGSYLITLNSNNANYSITVSNSAYYIISAREIKVSASLSGTYGNEPDLDKSKCTISNLVSGHTYETVGLSLTTTATSLSSVGSYPITFSCSNSNYTLSSSSSGTYTISKRSVTIRALEQSIYYGNSITLSQGENVAYQITSGSLVDAITISAILTDSSITSSSNVGQYSNKIQLSYPNSFSTNYNFTLYSAALNIIVRPITIKADDVSVTYGETLNLSTLTSTITNLVNSGSFTITYSTTYTTSTGVNSSAVVSVASVSGENVGNYEITKETGTVTINKREITILLDEQTVEYGSDFTLNVGYTVTSETQIVNSDDLKLTFSTTATKTSSVGSYAITATSANDNYDVTILNGTLKIVEGVVVVTIENQTFTYGEVNLNQTLFSVSGDVDASELGVILTTNATNTSSVGEYEIDATCSNTNYSIEVNKGVLNIQQRDLALTLTTQSFAYGSLNLDNSKYTITGTIYNSDQVTITLSTNATITSNVGSYYINATTTNGNYNLVYTEASLIIYKKDITISLNPQTGVYGENHATNLNQTGYTLSESIISGNNLNIVLTTNATSTSNVGAYVVSFTYASTNYNITNTTATSSFTITARPIILTANDVCVIYGEELNLNSLIFEANNLANEDVLTGSFTSTYTKGMNVNQTAVVSIDSVSGEKVGNYSITKVDGVVYVTARQLTVTANNQTTTYGEEVTLTSGYEVNSSNAIVTGDDVTITLSCAADSKSGVGSYDILVSVTGEDAYNYLISTIKGSLTIAKRAITIMLKNQAAYYGKGISLSQIAYTITSGSVVNNDDLGITISTTATNASPVGEYEITAESHNANYDVTFVNGVLTIEKVDIILTIENQTCEYGNVELNQTKASLNNGADLSEIGVELKTDATNASPVGKYEIYATWSNTNYEIGVVNGELTIEPKELKITILNQTCQYGAVELTTTYQLVSGYSAINGDDLGIKLSTNATNLSPVGNYDILLADYNANYTFTTITGGILTISPRVIALNVEQTSTYGNDISLNNSNFTVIQGSIVNSDDIGLSLTCSATKLSPVGSYTLTATLTNSNYKLNKEESNLTLEITKRSVTISTNQSSQYGNNISFNTANYTVESGSVVNGDNLNLTFLTNATTTSDIGEYNIILNSCNSNYNVTILNSCYKITERELVINIIQYGTYGNAIALNKEVYTIYSGSIVNSDNLNLAFTTNATSTSNAGTYNIYVSCGNANYKVTTNSAIYVIQPKALNVTILDEAYTYGDEIVLNNNNYTIENSSDIVNGDNLNITLTTNATSISNVGTYYISGGCGNSNYSVSFRTGELTINKRQIKIRLDNQQTTRGFMFEIDQQAYDIIEGSAVSLQDLAIEIYSNASKNSFMGTYELMAKTKNGNYDLLYESAELKVGISFVDVGVVAVVLIVALNVTIIVIKKRKKKKLNKELFDKWIGW